MVFDTVEWLCMFEVLAKFGFVLGFLKWVPLLYFKPLAHIQVKWGRFPVFECNRVLRPLGADEELGPIGRCPRWMVKEIACRRQHTRRNNPEEEMEEGARAQEEDVGEDAARVCGEP
ncbi:hypothetical protein NDU88_004146 [Pleurodeles waltl]|uniref:Transmembrane protein n=1 Tax=Pleurodeles waltl TaxID=8319 RepID=A0AAV7SHX9_PLEWA|nr:hypothetical protein NDU88_004146 [Pleurodeles waltl]